MNYNKELAKAYILAKKFHLIDTLEAIILNVTPLRIDDIKLWEAMYAGQLWALDLEPKEDLCYGETKQEILRIVSDLIFDMPKIILPTHEEREALNMYNQYKQRSHSNTSRETTC